MPRVRNEGREWTAKRHERTLGDDGNVFYHNCRFVVQSLSRVRLFVTPWTAAHQASLSITNSCSLLKLMSVISPPNFNLSQHQVFPNKSVLHIRWPKYWSFSIGPSNEYSGLISFRIDWFDLLEVQVGIYHLPLIVMKLKPRKVI